MVCLDEMRNRSQCISHLRLQYWFYEWVFYRNFTIIKLINCEPVELEWTKSDYFSVICDLMIELLRNQKLKLADLQIQAKILHLFSHSKMKEMENIIILAHNWPPPMFIVASVVNSSFFFKKWIRSLKNDSEI